LKKDRSNFMNPLTVPPVPTKFVYTGDPETNTGWTEFKGCVQNCGGNNGTIISVNPPGDRRFIFSSGALNYSVNQVDTVIIYASQLIARGTSNLNSVTKLKNLANTAWDFYNSGFTVGIKTISEKIPADFNLYQNYPNPFNPNTIINFQLPTNNFVTLKIYDITGKEVETLVNEQLSPGSYKVDWNASRYPSGVYFYNLKSNGYTSTKKMILVK
ncbi:MAG: T9SS type A sorting domain-containing protein, partial [Ignavibacteria bacterium]|nr:T9SS type A sorting domain-containing protein [Ignavibacteria bacterium]